MSHRPPIVTIGYGSRTMDAFVTALKAARISFLVDVRSRPYSRYRPEFSKESLANALHQHGITYLFMGDELGGQPDDRTCYDAEGKVDYELCRQRAQFRDGIDRLRAAYAKEIPLALMCSESKPENCHRTKLIGEALVEQGIEVVHIDEEDKQRSHAQIMLRVINGQPSLFGDQFFKHTSRKSYRNPQDDQE